MSFLRRAFLGGLIVLLPTVVTLWVFWQLFRWLDNLLRPLFEKMLPFHVPGLGFVTVLLIILIAGFFAGSFMGRQLTALYKVMVRRLPLAGKVFNAVDRLLSVIQEQKNFKSVVCFEYPRKGSWSIGFVTNHSVPAVHGLVHEADGVDAEGITYRKGEPRNMLHVFLPTTPNPTSGFFLLIPADSVVYPDISIEEALNLIVSGGAILPGQAGGDESEQEN